MFCGYLSYNGMFSKAASKQCVVPLHQPKRQPKHRLHLHTVLPLPPFAGMTVVKVAHLLVYGQQLERA